MDDSQRLPPSKFSPRPLGPNQLERGRLVAALERHAHAKLVLMHAPAGYGKTTLMAQWYERLTAAGQGTGWVGLDDDDNDAGRLATVLSLALVPKAHGETDLFDAVNRCLQVHSHFTLFLDEEERITAADAQHLFEVLLKLSPMDFHLVIGSRTQPQKLSTRLLLRSDFLELTARELAFQPAEISQFIRLRCGVTLDPPTEAYLAQRTEGWAAVLQLAAADIARGESARTLFDHADSPNRNLFQYLSDEVLIHLRPQQHQFLLQTAFVDELSGPLCDAITGGADGEAMLLELQQSNLLLQAVDSSRRRFRYHALFAEFLQRQLRERHPGQLPMLARRASDWCARAGRPESAVEYALLADDTEHLMTCMRLCMDRLITRAQFATARRWLRALPRATLRQQPDLLVWNAWVDIYTNDFAAAQESVGDSAGLVGKPHIAGPRSHGRSHAHGAAGHPAGALPRGGRGHRVGLAAGAPERSAHGGRHRQSSGAAAADARAIRRVGAGVRARAGNCGAAARQLAEFRSRRAHLGHDGDVTRQSGGRVAPARTSRTTHGRCGDAG